MRRQLRPFQANGKAEILASWAAGHRNVLAVYPTGAGKTVLAADIVLDERGATCVIAHRHELVSQISLALARNGVRHRIIGSSTALRACVSLHKMELGCSFIDCNSNVAVAGVDTLVKRGPAVTDAWLNSVTLWIIDESHHVLKKNKWGKAAKMFPNARGLGLTATPCRADGHGLGDDNDGVFHKLIVGPSMRDLIRMGFLTEYRVFCPPVADLHLEDVPLSAGGDFSPEALSKAVHSSHIVGDVVQQYLKIAPGKRGITFAVDIAAATELAQAYRDAGVPAEVISSKTDDVLRANILRKLRLGEVLQLVNVDLFGEGFDLPAIEVVSMARPTQSYSLYAQQFGRVLRLLEGKFFGIVIDHVGNVMRHGLPDKIRIWTLDAAERRASSAPDDVVPITVCVECVQPYERIYKCCPHCGYEKPLAERSAPQHVDGDLLELTPDVLARLRGEIDAPPVFPWSAEPVVVNSIKKRHGEKIEAQAALRERIALWAGWQKQKGHNDSEIYRAFYFHFGTDVFSAQTLNAKDAGALDARIAQQLTGVV